MRRPFADGLSRSSALLLYSTRYVRKYKDSLGVTMNAQTVLISTDKRGVGDDPIYDDSICESAGMRVGSGRSCPGGEEEPATTVVRKVSSP